MFEKASRLKLRFTTPRGLCAAEDLWDIPLTTRGGDGMCLDNLAKDLNREVKESGEESFVVKKSEVDAVLDLKFNIVKHVIEIKLTEADTNEKKAMSAARKQHILEIIADKNEEGLRGRSVEELREMLEEE